MGGKARKKPEPVNDYAALDGAPFDIGRFTMPFEKGNRLVKVIVHFPEGEITELYVDQAVFAKTRKKGVNMLTLKVLYGTKDGKI